MSKENSIGRITFSYETIGMTSTTSPATNVPLLTLALPHHAASITTAEELLLQEDDFDLTYWSIKGQMVPVIGDSWAYEEELTFTAFGDDPSLESSQLSVNNESKAILALDQSIRDLLLQTVLSDLDVNLPDLSNGAYGAGKQIARLAQLAHIAQVVHAANVHVVDEEVNRIMNNTVTQPKPLEAESSLVPIENAASSVPTEKNKISSGTSRKAYALLEKYLTLWLGDQKEKRLVYDAQLGGILSTKGMEDVNADFGNSRYNDHHFHYGYVLFAAAILGRANPNFISLYGPYVDALFYDVAHNGAQTSSDSDIFFPLARHKSWFDGVSHFLSLDVTYFSSSHTHHFYSSALFCKWIISICKR
jgi:endo-1,3(4)-beta-glucanase